MAHTARQDPASSHRRAALKSECSLLPSLRLAADQLHLECPALMPHDAQVKAAIGGPAAEYAGWASYRCATPCCIVMARKRLRSLEISQVKDRHQSFRCRAHTQWIQRRERLPWRRIQQDLPGAMELTQPISGFRLRRSSGCNASQEHGGLRGQHPSINKEPCHNGIAGCLSMELTCSRSCAAGPWQALKMASQTSDQTSTSCMGVSRAA